MTIVIKNQVAASEKSALELEEQMLRESQRALLSFEVRDLAKSAVSLLDTINTDMAEWQVITEKSDRSEELCALGDDWDSLYRRLAGVFEKTARLIKDAEMIGPEVAGKPEFFKAWRGLRAATSFTREDVALGASQASRNEVRSLGDIVRALFSSTHDESGARSSKAPDSGSEVYST